MAAQHGFSPDKVAEFKEAYDLWNSDGDDKLDVSELTTALKNLGSFENDAIEKILSEVCLFILYILYIFIYWCVRPKYPNN